MQLFQKETKTMRGAIVCTARLLFDTKGFDLTTSNDVMRALHIDEEIFRKNFHSMDELLEAVWSE